MEIRRAEVTDEESLRSIRRDAILWLGTPVLSSEQAEEWARSLAADRISRAILDHDVWVAVEQVAMGWVEVHQDRVMALYVSPPFSRQGVGSELLRWAETAIRNAGHETARLEASQNALGFYLRRGYCQSGTTLADGSFPLIKNMANR